MSLNKIPVIPQSRVNMRVNLSCAAVNNTINCQEQGNNINAEISQGLHTKHQPG